MNTDCTSQKLSFGRLGRREIVADFNGGDLSSDGGVLLLRQVEQRTKILASFADCFTDHRQQGRVEHTVEQLATQRVLCLILVYEDLNDHDQLRYDPPLAVAVCKHDPLVATWRRSTRGRALPGRASLNRLSTSP